MASNRSGRSLFLLVWAMFIVKGLVYVAVTPLWEGFDELFHFAYIHRLAAAHSLPRFGETTIDGDIALSSACVPLPATMPKLGADYDKLSHREYWQMAEPERRDLADRLRQLHADPDRLVPSSVPLYQLQHPPLYYALCVPLYEAMGTLDIVQKVFALRVFSVLLASMCVIAAALVAGGNSALRYIFAGLVALWPVLYVDIARVGNDSLGIVIFSFLLVAMVRFAALPSPGRAAAAGVLLGLGLLTKAYFLTAAPAVVCFLIYSALADREKARPLAGWGCVILACAALVGGWWYLRSYLLYGSFSGLQESLYYPAVGLRERIRAALEAPWVLIAKHMFVSFSWVSGWSFVHLPKPFYLVFVILCGGAAAGLAKGAVRAISQGRTETEPALTENRPALAAAACLTIFFVLGVVHHEINAFATVGLGGGPGGWYFYAIVASISLLAACGIRLWGLTGRRAFLVLFAAVWATEVYGFLFVLAPYYAGLAVPAASGWGVSYVEEAARIFSGQTLARLLPNKPALISRATLGLLALAYLAAHAALLLRIGVGVSSPPAQPSANLPK